LIYDTLHKNESNINSENENIKREVEKILKNIFGDKYDKINKE